MTDFISSLTLNYCHFSAIKVDCGNANFSKFFMYAKIISLDFTMHYNASAYPQIVKTNPCSSYSKCKTNLEQVISYLNLKLNPKFASYLNFLQFFIVYPGISNPGPVTGNMKKDLSVFYQNVQGLIPFGSLTDQHPNLDITKIYELQAYIFEKNPDKVILNETWLKPKILSSEIFPKQYNVYRLDRSPQSHPVDPLSPKKFKKNGGGVLILIAVNNYLSLQSKIIPIKCAADLLAVELIFPDSTKITTCYRVGTLGTFNCNEILQTLNKLSRKKNALKISVRR